MKEIFNLFSRKFGHEPDNAEPLTGAGSPRVYERLSFHTHVGELPAATAIITRGDNIVENRSFIRLSDVFRRHGVKVPVVYGCTADYKAYLQEDLGEHSLLDIINTGDLSEVEGLVKETINELVKMQTIPENEWEPYIMESPFNDNLIMRDLNYFRYCFLKPSGIAYNENKLEVDFATLTGRLLSAKDITTGFMMRDCQSRNVMVTPKGVYLIDFQGGFKGPGIYDAVSLLWQAKAGFTHSFRDRMLRYYAEKRGSVSGLTPSQILEETDSFVLLRMLQVMGAYGFRGLMEHKSHFIQSIPSGIANLAEFAGTGKLDSYPELKRIIEALAASERFKKEENSGLTVKVFSFSYKKGYPEDLSGNGGGFIFDCRGMDNPGRYVEYRSLTGLDSEVQNFLEEKSEVHEFLKAAGSMVFPSIRTYLDRGFNSLLIGFGCTGGQHRSVYCAQKLGEEIRKLYPEAKVIINHREQGIIQ